ncbi:MAG: hypothetical protein QM692_16590 [Thermomicrobiales bacterium]
MGWLLGQVSNNAVAILGIEVEKLALFLSAIALAQPWAVDWWKRRYCQGTVTVHPTKWNQIGYGVAGPTIRLIGNIRAIEREQFVQSMTLEVKRAKNSATNNFEWRFFNLDMLAYQPAQNWRQELPMGFMVAPVQSYRYDITFGDAKIEEEEMRPLLQGIWDMWNHQWLSSLQTFTDIAENNFDQSLIATVTQQVQDAFLNSQEYRDAVVELERLSFWEQGSYDLRLTIHLADPDKTVSVDSSFEITKEEANGFRVNAELIGLGAIGLSLPRKLYEADKKSLGL